MKTNRARLSFSLAVIYATVASAQPQKSRYKYQNDAQIYAEIAKAPEKARAKANPLADDTDAVPAGAILFAQHCAECHGSTAEGSKKAPSLRVSQVQEAPPGAIFWILTNGVVRRGMPVWSKLPEPQRWQLIAYLRSLGPEPR